MITRRFVLVLVAGLASCSSGGSSTPGPVTLDLSPLVTVPVTPADPTVPETTIAATTTTTTELLVTTTTIDPKAEVEAAYLATVEVREACNFDPVSCAYDKISVPGSPSDLLNRDTMKTRIDSNLRAVEGFGFQQTRVDGVVIGGDVAFVTTCSYDSVVIFAVGDPTNPVDDIVYNDAVTSRISQWEMRRTEGIWVRYEGTGLEKLTGGDLCGF
jgi:hypothetical protein